MSERLVNAPLSFVSRMLGSSLHTEPKPPDTSVQMDPSKLALSLAAGVGVGTLVALVAIHRRQRANETARKRTEYNEAVEPLEPLEPLEALECIEPVERVEPIERIRAHYEYYEVIEQLGHHKAAVRLGGLYSLERLAQENPHYRQDLTEAACAYLRKPFEMPPPATIGRVGLDPPPEPASLAAFAARQELQVRLTAQRLLQRHLTTARQGQAHHATYWENIYIDLNSALLIDFDFSDCCPLHADFSNARFNGDAWFDGVRFSGIADFTNAQFSGDAWFDGASFGNLAGFSNTWFTRTAWFRDVQFNGYSQFRSAQFNGDAVFREAQFWNNALFNEVWFNGNAWFDGAWFSNIAGFNNTRFTRTAWFRDVQFNGYSWFHKAEFSEDAVFRDTQFNENAGFGNVRFTGDAGFRRTWFNGDAMFRGARFNGTAKFSDAWFATVSDLTGATVDHPNLEHVWPATWDVQTQPLQIEMAALPEGQWQQPHAIPAPKQPLAITQGGGQKPPVTPEHASEQTGKPNEQNPPDSPADSTDSDPPSAMT